MTGAASATPAIRRAVRADLLAVLRIERASFPQPWPLAAFERFVGEGAFFVAEADDDIVGYVVADVSPHAGRLVGHVKDIAVHPDYRQHGIGATLLERALRALAGAGADTVKLEVRESNRAATALYRSFGFDHRHTEPGYYDNGEDALVMVSDLAAERKANPG